MRFSPLTIFFLPVGLFSAVVTVNAQSYELVLNDTVIVEGVMEDVNYGTAVIRYAVWDVEFPDEPDTLTFIINTLDLSGISGEMQVAPNRWFGEGRLFTRNIKAQYTEIRLVDINGREVVKSERAGITEFEIKDL